MDSPGLVARTGRTLGLTGPPGSADRSISEFALMHAVQRVPEILWHFLNASTVQTPWQVSLIHACSCRSRSMPHISARVSFAAKLSPATDRPTANTATPRIALSKPLRDSSNRDARIEISLRFDPIQLMSSLFRRRFKGQTRIGTKPNSSAVARDERICVAAGVRRETSRAGPPGSRISHCIAQRAPSECTVIQDGFVLRSSVPASSFNRSWQAAARSCRLRAAHPCPSDLACPNSVRNPKYLVQSNSFFELGAVFRRPGRTDQSLLPMC